MSDRKKPDTIWIGEMNAPPPAIHVSTKSALGGGLKVRVERAEPDYLPVAVRAPETAIKRFQKLLREEGMAAVLREVTNSSKCGSEIGWMQLRGEITEAQLGACEWYCEVRAAYMLAIEAKDIKSGSPERRSPSTPPDPNSVAGRAKARHDRRAKAEFESLQLAALACGRGEYLMFRDVVLDGAAVTFAGKKAVQKVSEAIRRHRAAENRARRGKR